MSTAFVLWVVFGLFFGLVKANVFPGPQDSLVWAVIWVIAWPILCAIEAVWE